MAEGAKFSELPSGSRSNPPGEASTDVPAQEPADAREDEHSNAATLVKTRRR